MYRVELFRSVRSTRPFAAFLKLYDAEILFEERLPLHWKLLVRAPTEALEHIRRFKDVSYLIESM